MKVAQNVFYSIFTPHFFFKANLTGLQRTEFMALHITGQCICALSFPKEYEASQNPRGPALLTLVAGFFPVSQG